MQRTILSILIFLLAACLPLQTQTSEVSETLDVSTVPVTIFPEATVTQSETAAVTPPTVMVTNPEAWMAVGAEGKVLTRLADMTLWDGPEEQRFAVNPDAADKLYGGLLTFAAMINWHGNDAIRTKYKTFIAYEQNLKQNPEQAEWLIAGSNYKAGNVRSFLEAKFVLVEGGVDLNRIAVAVDDADDTPEGEGWMHLGAGVVFKMNIKVVEGKM